MVESSECWLLIGREVPPEVPKGGTLTILNLGQSSDFDFNCHWISKSMDLANRSLPSIEGSDRLADTEMNSVKSSQLALINWFISDLANRTLPSIEGSDRLAPKKDEAVL